MAEDRSTERIAHTHIGGQAVLEGIMMRGKLNWAIAVRRPDGSVHVEDHDLHSAAADRAWLRKPIVRGVWALYETLSLAMKAFAISAEHAGETEEEKLSQREIGFTMIIGVALAILLFMVLPAVVTGWLVGSAAERPFTWNVLDGVLRILAFFAYIWAISRVKDIQRVFAYHGAEHKTIHAYEHGLPLEPAVIQRWETLHVRCGTSFLLMVMVIALFVYSLVPIKAILEGIGVTGRIPATVLAIVIRLVFLPVIAGLAYEVIKLAGRYPHNPFVKVLLWPGLQLQRLTTREPDDEMVEVAVEAMNRVVARETVAEAERPEDVAATPEPLEVLADEA